MAQSDVMQDLDPNPERFDPDRDYEVRLTEPIQLGQMTFSPAVVNKFRGDYAETVRDRIASSRVV